MMLVRYGLFLCCLGAAFSAQAEPPAAAPEPAAASLAQTATNPATAPAPAPAPAAANIPKTVSKVPLPPDRVPAPEPDSKLATTTPTDLFQPRPDDVAKLTEAQAAANALTVRAQAAQIAADELRITALTHIIEDARDKK